MKNQASDKLDEAKGKANELAADAKQKGQGKENSFSRRKTFSFPLELKHDAQQKGKFRTTEFPISKFLFLL